MYPPGAVTDIARRHRTPALTAAGVQLAPARRRAKTDTNPPLVGGDAKVNAMWRYRDSMPGPSWFSLFVAEQMRLVRFHAARIDPNEPEPVRVGELNDAGERVLSDADEMAVGYVDQIRARSGDKGPLISGIVENLVVDGRAVLVAYARVDAVAPPPDNSESLGSQTTTAGLPPEAAPAGDDGIEPGAEDDILWFDATSVDGARIRDGRVEIAKTLGSGWEPLSEHSRGYLIWKRHPRHATMFDSPYRAAYDTLRRIEKLDQLYDAAVQSRLLGRGLFMVPKMNAEIPSWLAGIGPEDGSFWDRLLAVMAMAIDDRDLVAAAAPIAVEVPADLIKEFRHIEFPLEIDEFFTQARERLKGELAEAWSVPTSQLSDDGIADLNHWSQWAEQESTVRTTWRPLAETIASAWTELILQPAMREKGVADWDRYVVWYDLDALVERPIRTGDAMTLYEAGLIDAEPTVRASGFSETEMPDEEARERWLLEKLMLAHPQYAPDILDYLGITIDLTATSGDGDGDGLPPGAVPDPTNDPPDGTGPMAAAGVAAATRGDAPSLTEAIAWAVLREREWIGRRLRGLTTGQERDTLTGVAPEDIAAHLGPDTVARLQGGSDDLARPAAFTELRHSAAAIGVTPDLAVQAARSLTLKTLFEPWRSASRQLRS